MTLEDELARQRARHVASRSREDQEVRVKAVQDVAASGLTERALGVGDLIPAITLPDPTGRVIDVSQSFAETPLVISFYRGGWCPYCNLELRALQSRLPEFSRLGAALIAISPELPDRSLTTAEKNDLTFTVLSDPQNCLAKAFGLVHRIDPRVVAFQGANGVDVAAANGQEVAEVPVPATYVTDRAGRIQYASVDADYTRRADPEEIVAALAAQQTPSPTIKASFLPCL
jgi:peroxiredoxin